MIALNFSKGAMMSQRTVMQKWSVSSGWLRDGMFDGVFIFGILALALTSGFIVWAQPSLFPIVLFLDLWFLGYHHVIVTFTKLAGTAQDRKDNRFLIYYLPPIILVAVLALAMGLGTWSVVTIYFFWQWYHYTRQSYGISIFYRRKSSAIVPEHPHFALAALWSIPIWGVLNRCAQGWESFIGMPIWLPQVPLWIPTVAGAVSCILVGLWCLNRLLSWYRGVLPVGQTCFILSHFVAFYVGYVLIPDISIGWLVANIWHNAQYILFVWLYNTNRFRDDAPAGGDALLRWMTRPKPYRALIYFTLCLMATTAFYVPLMGVAHVIAAGDVAMVMLIYVITFQTINFHHYVVDAMIWKARSKKNQSVMKLEHSI